MRPIYRNNGMTLVEVLISLAILGILLVILTGILSGGLWNITNAGKKTSDEFTAQQLMDKAINDPSFSDARVTVESTNMPVPVGGDSALIAGRKITVRVGDVKLTTFVADSN